MAVDARDNATYWVQKLADGRCWMLTNLAYGGGTSNGGTNTYSDVKTISNGESVAPSYEAPYYYIPPNSNKTINPTEPSTSTDGGATNPQYGYLYNWCAAMGVQTGTTACNNTLTPAPNTNISICPSGWRLPTGGSGASEYRTLNTELNNGITSSPGGFLSVWLGMYSGRFNNGDFVLQNYGLYWQYNSESSSSVRTLNITLANTALWNSTSGHYGHAVRCVAM